MENLLKSLKNAKWEVAFKTFGNDHATLIGLIVSCWVLSKSKEVRFALDSGLTFGYRKNFKGGGVCDAVLAEGNIAKGIVEVEGVGKYRTTVEKIGKYFTEGVYPQFKNLEFAILLVYPFGPSGRGQNRQVPPIPTENILKLAKENLSSQYPDKILVILILEKEFKRITDESNFRSRNEYHQCTPTKIVGYSLKNGEIEGPVTLAERE